MLTLFFSLHGGEVRASAALRGSGNVHTKRDPRFSANHVDDQMQTNSTLVGLKIWNKKLNLLHFMAYT